jgi:hypothetical protein
MSKGEKDIPELTDEELAFEMIDITCDEMNSLAKAFDMIADLCKEMNEEVSNPAEEPKEALELDDEEIPSEAEMH